MQRRRLRFAFQFTIVSLLSFLISYYTVGALQGQENLDATGAMWAMIFGILMLQDTKSAP
jgi:L-lactate permease